MAAEIDHQVSFESPSRSRPELSLDTQQIEYESVSIFDILDQGSVSFGKYATEALAWEKRSAFLHDRFQEELEKFKNPGLVAQKKAYFEEYYKKLRALKALQAEQQKNSQLEACPYAQNSIPQIEGNDNSTVLKDENNFSEIPIADNSTVGNLNSSSSGGAVYDAEEATEAQRGKKNFSTVKAKHSTKGTSLSQTSQSDSTKTAPKKSPVSNAVSHKADNLKKNVPDSDLQAKGTVTSVGKRTMLEGSRTTKNASKESEKPRPSLIKVIQKTGNILPSKKTDPKAASKFKSQMAKVFPTPTVPNSLLAKDKLVSSFSCVRARLMTPSTNSQGLAGKLPTSLPVNDQTAKPVPSSSSIRTRHMKPSTTCEGLAGKLPTRSSVQVQCAKSLSSTSSRRRTQQKPSTTSEGLAGKLPTRSSVQVQCAKSVSSTLSIRTPLEKQSTSSKGLAGKLPSRSSVHVPSANPVSSSSSIKIHPVKPITTPQVLDKKLPTKLPVNSESSKLQSISKDKASSGGLRNLVKRSVNLSSPSRSSQNSGAERGQMNLVQEGKNINEGKEKVVAELRRYPRAASASVPRRDSKPASSMVSNVSRTLR